jgi:hypothetical protein
LVLDDSLEPLLKRGIYLICHSDAPLRGQVMRDPCQLACKISNITKNVSYLFLWISEPFRSTASSSLDFGCDNC